MTTSPELALALAAVPGRMTELWALVEAWVGINSHTGNHAGCNQMADELTGAFALPGVTARRIAGVGSGDHLAFTTTAWRSRPGTALVGHHDTVFPPGTFEGFRRDDVNVYGPGVLDMKGGLAIVRTALAALADVGALAALPIAVISVADEETGSVDGRRVIAELAPDANAGLVFEAGRITDAIVTRRKGTGKLVVTARGKAAHAGNDLSLGINAIWALARFIDRVQALGAPDGTVTVNVGLIAGGTAANTVPADARCEIDLRITEPAQGDPLLAAIERAAREIAAATGATFSIGGGVRRQPLEHLAGTAALVERYATAARAEGLQADEAPLVGGGSDANTLAALGVPAIDGLGPRGRLFHTPDEFAVIATFEQRVRALVRYLLAG